MSAPDRTFRGLPRIPSYPPFATPGITDDERRTVAEMMAKGSYGIIVLATADRDGAFARLKASGAEIVQEPTDQPIRSRVMAGSSRSASAGSNTPCPGRSAFAAATAPPRRAASGMARPDPSATSSPASRESPLPTG